MECFRENIKKEIWDLKKTESDLHLAFENNSEHQLLAILKKNSFLFYELVSRKLTFQPIFHEISFGRNLRCDFVWLNDNSDGPEWVLVEVEKPKLELFTKKKEPTSFLNHALEQVISWRRYFEENSAENKNIFGSVAKFRYIVIVGEKSE